jgi:hypothetical protein
MRLHLIMFLSILVSCTVDKKQNPGTGELKQKDSLKQLELNQLKNSIAQEGSIKQEDNELIGMWQNSPEIGSGYTNHYEFFKNGDFTFNYNEMICDNRDINYSGTWELINDNDLKLTIKKKTMIIGGKLVPTGGAGSCASDYYIEGGEVKTQDLNDFKYQEIILSSVTIDTEKRDLKTRKFNKEQFWKIKDSASLEEDGN